MRKAAGLAAVALLGLFELGCLVEIDRASDAEAALRAARAEAARFQGRPGPAHRLNVIVFDPDDHQVVRVSLPFWLAKKIEGHVDWGEGDEGDRIARRVRRHVALEELQHAGLGLIVDVEDDDGGRVLVWLR